jgi:hypothetical protein
MACIGGVQLKKVKALNVSDGRAGTVGIRKRATGSSGIAGKSTFLRRASRLSIPAIFVSGDRGSGLAAPGTRFAANNPRQA